jgi:hypothetical protein
MRTGVRRRLIAASVILLLASPLAWAGLAVQDRISHPIHSLLLEKESPLLGIHWSGELFLDLPLGEEPPGTEFTLRRAKLKFHRRLSSAWQVKLSAN